MEMTWKSKGGHAAISKGNDSAIPIDALNLRNDHLETISGEIDGSNIPKVATELKSDWGIAKNPEHSAERAHGENRNF